MLQSYVLEVHKPHNLASLAERHLGRKAASATKTCAARARTRSRLPGGRAKAAEYSCEDSDQTLDVHRVLWPQLQADDKLRHLRAGDRQQRGAVPDRAQRRADRRAHAGRAKPRTGPAHRRWKPRPHELAGPALQPRQPQADGEIFLRTSWACRWSRRPPPARPAPTRRCWKSWPRTTRCPPRSWSTAGLSKLKGTYTDKLAQLAHRAPAACTPTTRRRWR